MADITPTGTDIQISTDSAFSTIVLNDSGAYRTTKSFTKGTLPYGVDLYARVRHAHPSTGTTNWSNATSFKIIIPANIAGVCLDMTEPGGTFYWIDALGNQVSSFDWTKHPVYTGISMATVDDSRSPVTVTKIPLFYIRTAVSGPVGTFADGKKCWWISDLQDTGYRPAACFKRSTSTDAKGKYVISPYCYVGTFLGHTETVGGVTCLGSKRSQTVAVSQTKATIKTYISNRNNTTAGVSGFRMFDIWDIGALRILMLVAKANTDSQNTWGDNSTPMATPKTGSTNARVVFKGTHSDPQISIEDLWRCFWYYVDQISVSATGVVSLTSPMDSSTALSFGNADAARYTQATNSGWVRDILDCPFTLGNENHDLMELFLPKVTVSTAAQAIFSDQFLPNSGDVLAGMAYAFNETYQSYEQTGTNSVPYQSYEQTGTTSVSYWSQYGSGCPKRSYYSTPGQTYAQRYGTWDKCPKMGAVCYTDNSGHASTCSNPKGYYGEVGYAGCKAGSNTGRSFTWRCGYCGQTITCTHRNWATCYPPGNEYPGSFTASCSAQYLAATSGYKCSLSGGNCASSGCGYTYSSTPVYGYVTRYKTEPVMGYVTRNRTTNYTNEPGIFSMATGVATTPDNTNMVAGRLSKN